MDLSDIIGPRPRGLEITWEPPALRQFTACLPPVAGDRLQTT